MADWHDPYAVTGDWYRGNSHMHTFHGPADSVRTNPRVIVAWYRDHGYQWLNFSDHTHITRVALEGHTQVPTAGEDPRDQAKAPISGHTRVALKGDDMVVLTGHESDCVVAIGVEDRPEVADGPFEVRAERLAFWVADIVARGGVAQIAHPRATLGDWEAHLHWLTALDGASLIELYNHRQGDYGGRIHWRAEYKYAVDIWDRLLLAGMRIWPAAVDDCHDYLSRPRIVDPDTGERAWDPIASPAERFFESGGGWTCVLAEALDADHLKAAMRRGAVYASQGPVFERVGLQGGRLEVEAAACRTIRVIADGGTVAHHTGQHLAWDLPAPAAHRYLRVELEDDTGHRAWSAPFFSAG